jgi:hypothetical protein
MAPKFKTVTIDISDLCTLAVDISGDWPVIEIGRYMYPGGHVRIIERYPTNWQHLAYLVHMLRHSDHPELNDALVGREMAEKVKG